MRKCYKSLDTYEVQNTMYLSQKKFSQNLDRVPVLFIFVSLQPDRISGTDWMLNIFVELKIMIQAFYFSTLHPSYLFIGILLPSDTKGERWKGIAFIKARF